MVLSAASDDAMTIAVRRIGPALVFERLWEETGCRAVITELAAGDVVWCLPFRSRSTVRNCSSNNNWKKLEHSC
jgi:hypothetical protein